MVTWGRYIADRLDDHDTKLACGAEEKWEKYDWFLRTSNEDRNQDFESQGTYVMSLIKIGDNCEVKLALKAPMVEEEEEAAFKTLASLTVLGAAYVASQL